MEQNNSARIEYLNDLPQDDFPIIPAYAKPKREFTGAECIFAWLSLFLGYFFCRAYPVHFKPLGGLIFLLIIYAATAMFLKIKKATFGKAALAVGFSGIMVAFSLFFSANAFIHTLAYSYAIAAYCYFVYASFENRLEGGFSNLVLIDFFKAIFVMPFYSFGQMFSAFASKTDTKIGSGIKKLLLGVAIAFIPTVIILVLLSYDSDFTELLDKIFDISVFDVFSHLVSIGFGIPVGMFIYGLFISSADKSLTGSITAKQCHETGDKMHIAHPFTVLVAVLPILFVYVVFFISQWKYYTSGFVGVLPDETSYANYAREGFFQLCAVSVINLIIIGAVSLFIKYNAKGKSVILRILSMIFALFTLILISTAMAKLIMYINRYGLTQKRVYAAWFMAVLALIFLFMLVKQFAAKIKLIPTSVVIFVVMFCALGLSGIDGSIAKYNVDRYLKGELENIRVYDLEELGDSAIPQMVRLKEELQNRDSDRTYEEDVALWQLEVFIEDYSDDSNRELFEWTLPAIRSMSAVEE